MLKNKQTNKQSQLHHTDTLFFPTVESYHRVEGIFVYLVEAAASQGLHGEGRVGGQGAEAGEQVHGDVRAAGVGFLGRREADGGAQDGASGIWRGGGREGGREIENLMKCLEIYIKGSSCSHCLWANRVRSCSISLHTPTHTCMHTHLQYLQ